MCFFLSRGDSAGSITSGLLSDPRQAGGLAERGRAESAASDFSQIILGEGGAADDDWLRQGTLQATSSNEAGQGAARSNRRRVVIAGMVFWLASLGTYAYVLTGPIVSFTTSGLVGDATIFFKQNDVGQDVQVRFTSRFPSLFCDVSFYVAETTCGAAELWDH